MFSIAKSFEFDAAHRLWGHSGSCANLHGHRYKVEIEIEALVLDEQGFVFDFTELGFVKEFLNTFWDHATLVNGWDEPLINFLLGNDQKMFICQGNPTAENMAYMMLEFVVDTLEEKGLTEIRPRRVTVWETPSCKATVEAENSGKEKA